MARMALRPALRAYAHAPAGAEEPYANLESITFDGVDEKLRTSGDWPELAASGGSPGYSISWWMKLSSTLPPIQGDRVMEIHNSGGVTHGIRFNMLYRTSGGVQWFIYEGNANSSSVYMSLDSSWVKTDDLWHHYCFTSLGDQSTNSVSFYLDAGTPQEFNGHSLHGSPLPQQLNLASSTSNPTKSSPCQFDEISFWSTKLPATGSVSVASLYNSGDGPTDLTGLADLEHWWRFESALGDSGSSVSDQVGSWDLDDDAGTPVLTSDVP